MSSATRARGGLGQLVSFAQGPGYKADGFKQSAGHGQPIGLDRLQLNQA